LKATVLTACALMLIGVGLGALTTRPDRVAAQSVKIEPGRKPTPKPATPTPPPRKPVVNRMPRRADPEIEMVLVYGGSFLMGSPENEPGRSMFERPNQRVAVRSFYIGKYEVTQAQWRAVMGGNPSFFKGDNLPVENVSWDDAKEFCLRLSQMTGKEYRLPTEAEWEYACRARTTGHFAGDLDAMAWYSKNSNFKTHTVGRKQPNAFGLFDMQGNVAEWCEDDLLRSYETAPSDGSAWVDKPARNSHRVVRGCGWGTLTASDGTALRIPQVRMVPSGSILRTLDLSCRSAYRIGGSPGLRDGALGFRLVRTSR